MFQPQSIHRGLLLLPPGGVSEGKFLLTLPQRKGSSSSVDKRRHLLALARGWGHRATDAPNKPHPASQRACPWLVQSSLLLLASCFHVASAPGAAQEVPSEAAGAVLSPTLTCCSTRGESGAGLGPPCSWWDGNLESA